MSACNRVGCDMAAKWRLGVKLWGKGFPRTSTPCTMSTGVVVCDHHKENAGPVGEFFTPEARVTVEKAFRAMGKAQPDFDGGEWHFTPLPVAS